VDAPDPSAPDANAVTHVATRANTTVESDLRTATDRRDDLGQLIQRRRRPIQLAPTVIGHQDRRRTSIHRRHRGLSGQDTLGHPRQPCELPGRKWR
jgi:hypothetical protein